MDDGEHEPAPEPGSDASLRFHDRWRSHLSNRAAIRFVCCPCPEHLLGDHDLFVFVGAAEYVEAEVGGRAWSAWDDLELLPATTIYASMNMTIAEAGASSALMKKFEALTPWDQVLLTEWIDTERAN